MLRGPSPQCMFTQQTPLNAASVIPKLGIVSSLKSTRKQTKTNIVEKSCETLIHPSNMKTLNPSGGRPGSTMTSATRMCMDFWVGRADLATGHRSLLRCTYTSSQESEVDVCMMMYGCEL